VIGIQPLCAPEMALSWRQRTVVETDRIETIADGVAGRYPRSPRSWTTCS
jgi:threonine dehydratase